MWNTKIDAYFWETEFQQSPYEYYIYTKKKDGDIMSACLYQDDMIKFETTNIREMCYFLRVGYHSQRRNFHLTEVREANPLEVQY